MEPSEDYEPCHDCTDPVADKIEQLEAEMFAIEDSADGGPMDYVRAALHADIERSIYALRENAHA